MGSMIIKLHNCLGGECHNDAGIYLLSRMWQLCLFCLTREVNALRAELEHMRRFEK